jgi:hypothetical protein
MHQSLERLYINMVDIIDSTYTMRAPPCFNSVEELREYTRVNAKFISRNEDYASPLFISVKGCLSRV